MVIRLEDIREFKAFYRRLLEEEEAEPSLREDRKD
jgi:hypothetical protein